MGHLIPLVGFAKRLVHHHTLSVTFLIPTTKDDPPSSAAKSVLSDLPLSIRHVFLPPPTNLTLPDHHHNLRHETIISLTVSHSLPSLRSALTSLSTTSRVSALIVDIFSTDTFDGAADFGISPYLFFPSTAMALSLCFYLPELDASVSCEYRDMPEPVKIPGCIRIGSFRPGSGPDQRPLPADASPREVV